MQPRKLLLLFLILLPVTLISCGNPATVTTPAPPQSLDLTLAKSLLEAQTIIEQAKTLVATNPSLKEPINTAIAYYNTAERAYLAYHTAVASGSAPDATALQAQVAQLTTTTQQLKGAIK